MRIDPPDLTDGDAFSETIGGMFDIGDQDLDNQLVEITSVQEQPASTSIDQTPTENSDMASDFGDLF
jgi:hypothetical protein